MTTQDMIALTAVILTFLTSISALFAWISRKEIERIDEIKQKHAKEINAQRDMSHLLRNYENLAMTLNEVVKELDRASDKIVEAKTELMTELIEVKSLTYGGQLGRRGNE